MLSLYVLGIALSRFMMAAIADRVSWFAVLAGMLVVALLLHTLTVSGLTQRWLGGALPAALVFATLGFFIGPIYPTLNALLLMRTPRADQASMQGLLVVFSASGGMLGSMMLGAMMRSMDANLAYVSSLVPLTLLLASLFVIRRKAALLPETV
jgi:MFS family permease